MYYIYRIYYDDKIVYVGRTNNINNRIRQHITSTKFIDVRKVSKIEVAEVDTEADMNLYELYYILKLKPILNSKDTTKDELSIELEELTFYQFYSYLYDQWKQQALDKFLQQKEKQQRLDQIKQQLQSKDVTLLEKDILPQQYMILKGVI